MPLYILLQCLLRNKKRTYHLENQKTFSAKIRAPTRNSQKHTRAGLAVLSEKLASSRRPEKSLAKYNGATILTFSMPPNGKYFPLG